MTMLKRRQGILNGDSPTKRQWAGLLIALVLLVSAGGAIVHPWKFISNDTPNQNIAVIKEEPKEPTPPPEPPLVTGRPSVIELPEIGLTHSVMDGVFDAGTNQWTTSDTQVLFATQTTQPNNKEGNTFIYGHATNTVFGPILGLQPGQTARVTTDNGYIFTYRLASSEVVNPTDTAVFTYEGAPRLTLQTCTGPTLTEYRHLFYFDLVGFEKVAPQPVASAAH